MAGERGSERERGRGGGELEREESFWVPHPVFLTQRTPKRRDFFWGSGIFSSVREILCLSEGMFWVSARTAPKMPHEQLCGRFGFVHVFCFCVCT
jgi:hypothetical protein